MPHKFWQDWEKQNPKIYFILNGLEGHVGLKFIVTKGLGFLSFHQPNLLFLDFVVNGLTSVTSICPVCSKKNVWGAKMKLSKKKAEVSR